MCFPRSNYLLVCKVSYAAAAHQLAAANKRRCRCCETAQSRVRHFSGEQAILQMGGLEIAALSCLIGADIPPPTLLWLETCLLLNYQSVSSQNSPKRCSAHGHFSCFYLISPIPPRQPLQSCQVVLCPSDGRHSNPHQDMRLMHVTGYPGQRGNSLDGSACS